MQLTEWITVNKKNKEMWKTNNILHNAHFVCYFFSYFFFYSLFLLFFVILFALAKFGKSNECKNALKQIQKKKHKKTREFFGSNCLTQLFVSNSLAAVVHFVDFVDCAIETSENWKWTNSISWCAQRWMKR